MSDVTPTPGRVTRGAGAPGRVIDYRQVQIMNSPATFTTAPPRQHTPAVPSRLRQDTHSASPAPQFPSPPSMQNRPQFPTAQASGSSSRLPPYPQPFGGGRPLGPPPVSYPPGDYPVKAIPPGTTFSGKHSSRPVKQAMYSTYASRMRTGVTTLVQPLNITGGPNAAFTAALSKPSTSNLIDGPRRRGGRINYAEDDAFAELDDDDPEVDKGGGTRSSRRVAQMEKKKEAEPVVRDEKAGWSWLGERVPAERVTSLPVTLNRYGYMTQGEDQLDREAYKPVLLAPIRIELDTDTLRIRDYFTWNVNENLITPYEFAQTLCKDLNIPSQQYAEPIANMIVNQTEEYAALLNIDIQEEGDTDADGVENGEEEQEQEAAAEQEEEAEGEGEPSSAMGSRATSATPGESDVTPFSGSATPVSNSASARSSPMPDLFSEREKERKSARKGTPLRVGGKRDMSALEIELEGRRKKRRVRFNRAGEGEEGKDVEEEGKGAGDGAKEKDRDGEERDCRVIVNLDVQISTYNLRDRIEWDLSSPLTPESFTHSYCADLSLTGEAIPLISHAIHEELLKHKKDAWEAGLYGPGAVQYEDKKGAPKRLKGVWRDFWEREEFGPVVLPLTAEAMQKDEAERSREARRMRREAARSGR